VERWSLVEELRYGAEDGPGSLADVRGIVVGDSGQLLVLDFKDPQIHLFDSLGNYLRAIGRLGQGPGEFSNANGMLRAPDGRLWLNDPNNSRFTVLEPDGGYSAGYPVQIRGYGYIWRAWFDRSGSLYEEIGVRVDTTYLRRLQRLRVDGASLVADTLPRFPCDSLGRTVGASGPAYRTPNGFMQVPFMASPLQVINIDNGAWCATGKSYEIHHVTLDDHATGVMARGTRPAVPVSAAERDSAEERVRAFFKQTGGSTPDLSLIPGEKPIFRSLHVDPAGRLWVGVNTTDPGYSWDLFDRTGRLLAAVRAPFEIAPYQPVVFQGDRIYAVASDTDVPTIVRARLVRAPLADAGKAR
jgi:hypothetical protein